MTESNEMIKTVYSDRSVLVCVKPAGVPCETANKNVKSITDLLTETGAYPYVGLVHRLDQVTEGLMVFSLSEKATGKLCEAIASRETEKEYLAVVHGKPETAEGEMKDLLFRDAKKNKSYVVKRKRSGVKEASLSYSLVGSADSEYGTLSLVRIVLHTGRTHQIRVQFASRGMPLLGDGKYGAADNFPKVALLSKRIAFPHPKTGERMEFSIDPDDTFPWNIF